MNAETMNKKAVEIARVTAALPPTLQKFAIANSLENVFPIQKSGDVVRVSMRDKVACICERFLSHITISM